MDQRVHNFITGFFREDMRDEWPDLRSSIDKSPPDYREAIRQGLTEILQNRPYTVEEWRRLTYMDVKTEDEVYADLVEGYEFLFTDDTK